MKSSPVKAKRKSTTVHRRTPTKKDSKKVLHLEGSACMKHKNYDWDYLCSHLVYRCVCRIGYAFELVLCVLATLQFALYGTPVCVCVCVCMF